MNFCDFPHNTKKALANARNIINDLVLYIRTILPPKLINTKLFTSNYNASAYFTFDIKWHNCTFNYTYSQYTDSAIDVEIKDIEDKKLKI